MKTSIDMILFLEENPMFCVQPFYLKNSIHQNCFSNYFVHIEKSIRNSIESKIKNLENLEIINNFIDMRGI